MNSMDLHNEKNNTNLSNDNTGMTMFAKVGLATKVFKAGLDSILLCIFTNTHLWKPL